LKVTHTITTTADTTKITQTKVGDRTAAFHSIKTTDTSRLFDDLKTLVSMKTLTLSKHTDVTQPTPMMYASNKGKTPEGEILKGNETATSKSVIPSMLLYSSLTATLTEKPIQISYSILSNNESDLSVLVSTTSSIQLLTTTLNQATAGPAASQCKRAHK